MEPKVITATELRTRTRDVVEDAKFKGHHFIVETFGKPMVAILGIDEYYELINSKASHSQCIETSEATDG